MRGFVASSNSSDILDRQVSRVRLGRPVSAVVVVRQIRCSGKRQVRAVWCS